MGAFQPAIRPLDFRIFGKSLCLWFYSLMPPQADASDSNVQPAASGNQGNQSMWQTGVRFALFGLIVNVLLATVKIFAGITGHAYVLIADGIESALDVAGSV